MTILLYPRLSTCSKRALMKTKKRWGYSYSYNPKGNLLQRLSNETGMTIEQVYHQLQAERVELLKDLEA
jgi:hypothetical protein